jgi:carboxyl-terminal processing protease
MLTNRLLGELQTSHTQYFAVDDPSYYGILSIFHRALKLPPPKVDGIDADIASRPEGHFIRVLFPDGIAEKAGLKRGDRLVAADEKPFHPYRAFAGKSGRTVSLTVQREKDGPTATVKVSPGRGFPRPEWLEAQKRWSRVVARNGRKVAYARLYSCAGEEHQEALHQDILERFQEAEALVIDFRDGWGGCNPTFMNLFNPLVPELITRDDKGKEQRFGASWRRPLVLLVNGGTRSGKEVVTALVRKHRLGKLVGERTAGAVIAGRAIPLGEGLLYLAVGEARIEGLPRLEGAGQEPDISVPDALPYANGADPQLERALDVAASAATS